MKKVVLLATAVLLLLASTAMADSIAGKFGITVRGGASYILNSEFTDEAIASFAGDGVVVDKDIKPGIGLGGGVGIMYGITDNLAVNFDVIYMQTDVKATGNGVEVTMGKGKTYDFALGAQWRFMPKSQFVPYVGAGFDILLNKFDPSDEWGDPGVTLDVATTYGGHLSVGADFFFTPNIALNAEIRGLYSTKGDITASDDPSGTAWAKYNPSNISGFLGIRFFFP